jgi:hypothetical protein
MIGLRVGPSGPSALPSTDYPLASSRGRTTTVTERTETRL